MDVKDYSQQISQVKDRYQDAANDIRSSAKKESEGLQETTDYKLKKQAEGYADDKARMEDDAAKNNKLYTDKTRETIAKRQDDFRRQSTNSAEKFDQEKNEMKKKYRDKIADVSKTYDTSTKENDQLHKQSQAMMKDRYNKIQGESQTDYNQKIEKFGDNAKKQVTVERESNDIQRKKTASEFQEQIEDQRAKIQDSRFKDVAKTTEENQKLRSNFEKERETASEQKDTRINDIIKIKNNEIAEGQKVLQDLSKNITEKQATSNEQANRGHSLEAKSMESKFMDELKNADRLSNQKIKTASNVDAMKDETKRMQGSYEDRLEALRKSNKDDMVKMSDREIENSTSTKEQLAAFKTKYNEDRELTNRAQDLDKNRSIQKLNEKNSSAIDRYKETSQIQVATSDEALEKTKKLAKERMKDQRVEFGKVVNNINEKNIEYVANIKDDLEKNKSKFQVKTQQELNEEKRTLREKMIHQVSVNDEVNQKRVEIVKKDAVKALTGYESKLEQIVRQNEKEVEMLKTTSESKQIKLEQDVAMNEEQTKLQHQSELKEINNKFQKMIEKDRVLGDQQNSRVIQKYEDQLDRERLAHQKEMALRTNEAQTQFERLFKASELEKQAMKSQFEDRIERLKLSSVEQGNTKKA